MLRSSIRCALVCLLAAFSAAQTLIVDINNGPGTNYTSIEAAVAAAPSGAKIVVRPGQYFESSLTISARSLTILGDGIVELLLPPGVPLRVEALGPPQRVTLRGFDIRQTQASGIVEIQCATTKAAFCWRHSGAPLTRACCGPRVATGW